MFKPLKGIGPATASLLLAVHDPDHVIFFSDQAYYWLCNDGDKGALKYDINEYEVLAEKAKAFMKRLGVTAIDVEKVAYVLMKEKEPVKEPKEPKEVKEPKARGRPRIPDSGKKVKIPSGKPRGRPQLSEEEKAARASETAQNVPGRLSGKQKVTAPSGRPRGRPSVSGGLKKPSAVKTGVTKTVLAVRGRGRPAKADSSKAKAKTATADAPAKKRGRPSKGDEEAEAPAKKRGRPSNA